jgi:hypothetical protein
LGPKRIMQLNSQRGQTMPFWTIGVLITLAMMFFVANYANAVSWQIRAQNAADSAASGTLSVQANMYNEYSVLLYATALDEYRLRALNQALLNTLYGVGGCSLANGTCTQDYTTLLAEYDAALNSYTDDIHLLDQGDNVTQAGQSVDQQKAVSILQGRQWCANTTTDYSCQFAITPVAYGSTATGELGGVGYNSVDVIACKNISVFAAALLKINRGTYQLIGRAAAAILPVKSETFKPGTQINTQTGQVYQPVEYWTQDHADPAYAVDFSGLNVNLNWYQAGSIRPFANNVSGAYTCS